MHEATTLNEWLVYYVVALVPFVWILWLGGDRLLERLGNSWLGGVFEYDWNAAQFRFYAGAVMLLLTGWFVAGLVMVEWRW